MAPFSANRSRRGANLRRNHRSGLGGVAWIGFGLVAILIPEGSSASILSPAPSVVTRDAWTQGQGCRLTLRLRGGSTSVRLEADGSVRDSAGALLGRLDNQGTIRDRSGRLLGRAEPGGPLQDRGGSTLARVDSQGAIRDRAGSLKMRIQSGGDIRSPAGTLLGRLDGYTAECLRPAAILLIFFGPPEFPR